MSTITCRGGRPVEILVGEGTNIKVCFPSGRRVLTYRATDKASLSTLSIAFQTVICKSFNVPQKCVNFVWPAVPNGIALETLQVVCMFTPIKDDETRDSDGWTWDCFICGDPCENTELSEDPDVLLKNCIRCEPVNLCKNCHIRIDRTWVCFACLEQEEWLLLDAEATLRGRLAWPPELR